MKEIYDSIKSRMEARGMSALSLAAASGVGKSTVYRIINNDDVSINMESLEKIMTALDMKLVILPLGKRKKGRANEEFR